MYFKAYYRRIKTNDGFTDFKHHSSSWHNSKKLRQRNRRTKLKLTSDQLEELYIEMLEAEEINREAELYCEHEDAGDRC